jgi:hypothetical protein
MQTKLLVGTSKGLIIYRHTRMEWAIDSIRFEGLPVSLVYIDERTNRWWVALSHRHWGEKLHWSDDGGKNWQEVKVPGFNNFFYRPGKPASLKKIWVMKHAGPDKPGGLWLGTEPGGLFYSEDSGSHFHLVESLWNHPSRSDDNQWFGAGKDYPFIHSIVLDPRNSNHVYIGISCAGVFETRDGGKSWDAKNYGLVAAYLPNPKAEVGHDPHQILICKSHPDVMWQQNHCGIFRTINGGDRWEDVSGKNGFPRYGFALAIDDEDPKVAFVIPAQSDEQRIPVDLRLTVCKTKDGGATWESMHHGLPEPPAFDLALRHAFTAKGATLAFGTNNGNLYWSGDSGETWTALSQNLASVNYLAFS